MPSCDVCNNAIDTLVAKVDNKTYHPDCLKCGACNQVIGEKQFIRERTGRLVCEHCNAKLAPKCKKCRLTFSPGESYKKISDDLMFHNDCFKCSGPCKKHILAEFYDLEDGNYLCTECYDKYGTDFANNNGNNNSNNNSSEMKSITDNFKLDLNNNNNSSSSSSISSKNRAAAEPKVEVLGAIEREPSKNDFVCFKCKKDLEGSYTTYNEKKYHAKCFVCVQCQSEFKEKSFYKTKEGEPLCRECHNKNLVDKASKCKKCSQPILDTVITYKEGEYHDYCLVCSLCADKLAGKSIYTDKEGKPYCTDCFTKKEAKTCAKCNAKIAPTETNLVFEGKNFHTECFVCKKCAKQIKVEDSFYKDEEDGVICGVCGEN